MNLIAEEDVDCLPYMSWQEEQYDSRMLQDGHLVPNEDIDCCFQDELLDADSFPGIFYQSEDRMTQEVIDQQVS